MLPTLSNTPISKHYCLCLNLCLDIPNKLRFKLRMKELNLTWIINDSEQITEKLGHCHDLEVFRSD